jgi:hypothetical protein
MRDLIASRGLYQFAAAAAVSYWAFSLTTGVLAMALSVVAPIAVWVCWEAFASPRAKVALPAWTREVLAVAIVAGAAFALAAAGEREFALGFVAAVAVDIFMRLRRRPYLDEE